ncbi:MAG: YCF48-related protein [Bacteroidetes bacterium]|nr:YCF48-related protein [Bacteroidota bacterium]
MKHLFLLLGAWLWATVSFSQSPEWNQFQTPGKASLRGLAPISDQVCWASGSGGIWLKTEDGGLSWQTGKVAGLDTVDFRSIHAVDANRAVVASAGQPAVIYRTEDGGNNWGKVHQEGGEAFFDAIHFVDPQRGYVLGDPIGGKWMILETTDGGKSWHSLPSLPEAVLGEAAFAASSSSLLADSEGLLFATGGSIARLHRYSFASQSWAARELKDMIQGESSQGVFAVTSIPSSGVLVLVGGDYLKPEVKDGNALLVVSGIVTLARMSPGGYRSGVAYLQNQELLVAVGPGGSDYSRDGGKNWQPFSQTGFHAVKAAPGGEVLWTSGSQGRLGKLVY